jgi:hypothetical protein
VQSLALMSTYARYFSAVEIKTILTAWGSIETQWRELVGEVRRYMDGGGRIDSEEGQALARRWSMLVHHWMGGDFDLIDRWGEMYRREPAAHGIGGAPPTDMMEFMERAIKLRIGLLLRHMDEAEFRRLRPVDDAQWHAIEVAGRKLLAAGRAPDTKAARALKERWIGLLDAAAGGDPGLRDKLMTLHRGDPLLLAGAPLSRDVRDYLLEVPHGA